MQPLKKLGLVGLTVMMGFSANAKDYYETPLYPDGRHIPMNDRLYWNHLVSFDGNCNTFPIYRDDNDNDPRTFSSKSEKNAWRKRIEESGKTVTFEEDAQISHKNNWFYCAKITKLSNASTSQADLFAKIEAEAKLPKLSNRNYKHKWKHIAGSAIDISVSSTGYVWLVNSAGVIYVRAPASNKWGVVRGKAKAIAAGTRNAAYLIGADGKTPYKGDSSGKWTKMPGAVSDIAAAPSVLGDHLWSLGHAVVGKGGHAIYRWEKNKWKRIPGEATDITVDRSGTAYLVNAEGNMYRMRKNEKTWALIPGVASAISAEGGAVWHLSKAETAAGGHAVYRSVDEGKTWLLVAGALTDIAATQDGDAWGVNKSGSIYSGD